MHAVTAGAYLAMFGAGQRGSLGWVDNGRAPRLAQLISPALGHGDTYQALALGLRSLVLDGQLVVGARVASERDLARELGLSRATVSAAYRRLRAEGFLRSDRGGGTRVHVPGTHPTRPDEPVPAGEDVIDLTIAALPAPGLLLEVVAQATASLPSVVAGPGLHPFGLAQLRRAIAGHLGARGLDTSPEQILVTQGALHGWDLVLRAFARPGDRVLAEQPTYPAVLDAARAHHTRPLPLGISAAGWDTGGAGARRGTVAPVLAHLTPEYQNPTGLRLCTAARRQLLLALPTGTTVVCDDTFADLALEPEPDPPAPFAALAAAGKVITLGSLSKSCWAGLRIGWIRADQATIRRLATARTSQDLGSPVLEQLVARVLLERFDEFMPERRRALLLRRNHLLDRLSTALPGWQPSVPRGGLATWVDLGGRASSTRLATAALACGVRLTPGPRFSLSGTHDRFLRLPFTLPEAQLDEAAGRLVAASHAADPRVAAESAPLVWTA